VVVAISFFETPFPVVLATVVDMLVVVPVMLTLVNIANKTRQWFYSD